MSAKKWIIIFGCVSILLFAIVGANVAYVDPYFHYHNPLTDCFFYPMDAEEHMNDGIAKRFEYNAMITGTSMTENFKTSEFESLFDVKAIKVPRSGGKYKVVNEMMEAGLKNNPDLKMVVRSVDMGLFWDDNKQMFRIDEGYTAYLYDQNLLNDYQYLLNRNVVFERTSMMEIAALYKTKTPGIISFDEYVNWMWMKPKFGKDAVYKKREI